MRLAIGECIDGRYEICGLLGEGGMAEVYRAVDKTTGRDVVLKVPHVAIAGDMAAFNRYRREIEIANGLDHPGLQRLLSTPDARYMVLEYVDGQALRKYLAARAPLPVEEVLRIAVGLAETLQYVHQQGIVHRDLKPDNMLIGPDGRVTLTDFGIALRYASRRITFNHLSNAVGTPDYMAPEQVRGERGDARTDVYAMGVLLFELLTGVVPYPTDDALEAMRRKVQTEPPLVRRLRPDVPPALEAVIYRALRRRPEERHASMAALAHDLQHLDQVVVPAKYTPDVPPPPPLGDLPPWRTTLPILAIIVGILSALGIAAELLHRNLAPR
jgi:eukaryotic-like serine/threonine-protein kinase